MLLSRLVYTNIFANIRYGAPLDKLCVFSGYFRGTDNVLRGASVVIGAFGCAATFATFLPLFPGSVP